LRSAISTILSFARRRGAALDPAPSLHYSSPGEAVKVSGLAWLLGTLSGLRFVAPHLPADVTIVTAIAMHVTHAVICRILAIQNGRSGDRWTIAGLAGGVLATAVLLIANERESARASRTPDDVTGGSPQH
jgi:hypothetical protein